MSLAAAGLLASCAAFAQLATDPAPDEALGDYVAAADASYEWQTRARYSRRGAEVLELKLHSQTWRNVLWKHQMLLIKPRRVRTPQHAVLIIGGGRWRAEYETAAPSDTLPEDADLFLAIANRLNAVVAVVGQVPFQPLFDLTEDRLIAYTFDRYLQTGDAEWPLLLPMVKAAVRAMDASSAAAGREWQTPLESFTVLGGSKRGWTTWLVGAVDERAVALVPAVIDALNMERHFPHQTAVWGAPSEQIRPYTDLDLHTVLGSDAGAELRRIVDPYAYRSELTQPKLVVLATNDDYFPVDSANLYWDALAPPKYLLYLPNDVHSIRDYRRLIASVRAVHASVESNAPLPQLEWEYRWAADALELCVRSKPAPAAVRLWSAASATRDFRDAVWTENPARRGGARSFTVSRPADGYSAVFAEAAFGRGRAAYTLSTNLAVLASAAAADPQLRPNGSRGVCAAAPEG
jgi:PhoPQ-activated pathogenicity-related protein